MRENRDLKIEERKLRVNNLNFKIRYLHLGQKVCGYWNTILH